MSTPTRPHTTATRAPYQWPALHALSTLAGLAIALWPDRDRTRGRA